MSPYSHSITSVILAIYFVLQSYSLEYEKCSQTPVPIRPKSSLELRQALTSKTECNAIALVGPEYEIDFPFLINSRTSLKGQGSNETTLKIRNRGRTKRTTALTVDGSNSLVTGLKIILLDSEKWTLGINLNGGGNILQDIHLELQGDGHNFGERPQFCLKLDGDNNSIDSVKCLNFHSGLFVNGSMNLMKKFKNLKNIRNKESVALQMYKGTNNLIEELRCEGLQDSENDWGLVLNSGTKGAKILDSVCGPVWVNGSDHNIFNLDSGMYLKVEGSNHKLEGVRAKVFANEGVNVSTKNNRLESRANKYIVTESELNNIILDIAGQGDILQLVGNIEAYDSRLMASKQVRVKGLSDNARSLSLVCKPEVEKDTCQSEFYETVANLVKAM